jgi:hypothetical protein
MKLSAGELKLLVELVRAPHAKGEWVAAFSRGMHTTAFIRHTFGVRVDYRTLVNLAAKGMLVRDDGDWRWSEFTLTDLGEQTAREHK